MPSSISSSDSGGDAEGGHARPDAAPRANDRDRYARETAADRPGVAQPVPVRPVPEQPWGKILLGVMALLALLVAGWESYWRGYDAKPGIRNTYALWGIQRQRIDAGKGNATVLVGGSRVYYDIQLPVWERLDGQRPIQLSFEGTSPLTYLEDLAADPKFVGRALVGVEPDLFFSGFEYRDLWQRIWRDAFEPGPDDPTPAEALKIEKEQIARAVQVVAKLRARGVRVLFVRMPSSGEYLAYENRDFPRARTWTALLAATAAPGIHFEDYPELQGYQLPDWSHLTHSEAERFTVALYGVVMRDFWGPKAGVEPVAPADR